MFLLSIFLPLFSGVFILCFGRFIGKFGVAFLGIFYIFLNLFISLNNLFYVGFKENFVYLKIGKWIEVGLFTVHWGFLFDSLTVIMIFVVSFISSLVHLYSYEYMNTDPYIIRFISYLSFFTFFMLILVTADNFVQIFLGWEGVGLCSYLLISFWNTRIPANKSAIKAIIINKIGDVGLILGIIILFFSFKTIDFSSIFLLTPFFVNKTFIFFGYSFSILNSAGFFLFIGAMAKSAQIGLHTWLPDAMEGPTPVSALIHAATMVTAGVFLIIRCSPIFEFIPNILIIITFIGALTAFFGATVGMLQNDIKKIIAYSTCSQLGYMILSCGLSNYYGSLFHLVNHAFFKALLFLSAGAIIHALSNEQSIRKMGGLVYILPFIYNCFLIGSLALCGFPFLSGFYSKDFILEAAFIKYTISSNFAFWLGTISAFFTSFYSCRLLYIVFLGENNSYKQTIKHIHQPGIFITSVLFILCISSLFVGYLGKEIFVGIGSTFLGSSIFILPWNNVLIDVEFLEYHIKIIPIIFSLFGSYLSLILNFNFSYFLIDLKFKYQFIYKFFNLKWYFDLIYNSYIGKPFFNKSFTFCFLILDKGILEIFGPFGINNIIYFLSVNINRFQTGILHNYICTFILNFLILLYFII